MDFIRLCAVLSERVVVLQQDINIVLIKPRRLGTGGQARMIKKEYIFPIVLIVLQVGAGIVCGAGRDYKMLVYWLAAAVLNIAVTF